MTSFAFIALGLILIRYFFELCLDGVNAAHVRKHSAEVPKAFRETMDAATYKKSVQYTLAMARVYCTDFLYVAASMVSRNAFGTSAECFRTCAAFTPSRQSSKK